MQDILYLYPRIPSLALVPSTFLIFCELLQNHFCECSCTAYTKKNVVQSPSQAFVLLVDCNYPDTCWKSSTASCKQARRLLECIEDNFFSQVTDSPTREDAILDLLVTNTRELISGVKIGGYLGCSDHALVEFTVLSDMGQAKCEVRTLNFRKANFQLFREFVNRTPLGKCSQGQASRTELAEL